MKSLLEMTLQIRKGFYGILKSTPREELLRIPQGYRNNIWWNIAHVVVTQQLLMYRLSGNEPRVPQEFIDKFKKGTVPDGTATDAEIDAIKSLLFTTIEDSIADYDKGLFVSFNEYTTSANVTLKSVDDAIGFNLIHEGIHIGSIFSLQKALKIEV